MCSSELKVVNLAKYLEEHLRINRDEAKELIYEEWDYIEELYFSCKKESLANQYFMEYINDLYAIA